MKNYFWNELPEDWWHYKSKVPTGKIVYPAGPFGIVIPAKSGVVWEHQYGGVMIGMLRLEGIYINLPLGDKEVEESIWKIAKLNYCCNNTKNKKQKIQNLWKNIVAKMPIKFDYTELGDGIGVITIDDAQSNSDWNLKALIGKKAVLIFPSSD